MYDEFALVPELSPMFVLSYKDKTEHSTQKSDKNVHREVTCNLYRNIVQHEHTNPEFRIGVNIDTSLILQINESLR